MDEFRCIVDFAELGPPLRFGVPDRILATTRSEEIPNLLQQVAVAECWAVGFLSYEAAAAFGLPANGEAASFPLAWFALFDHEPTPFVYPPVAAPLAVTVVLETSPAEHARALAAIHDKLLDGESYQVNLTCSANILEDIDLFNLFADLQPRHRFPFAAFMQLPTWMEPGGFTIASFSPELFVQRCGSRLLTAPIKGTRPGGATLDEERRLGQALSQSAKERAEHVMIVDMARNDLGRLCVTGGVGVPHLAERRRFSTVQHLETRVEGRLRPGVGLEAIMAALFPAASITGAPKHRTMEIIRSLEQRPRGVYTGAIGVVRPGGDCLFNVAIRTVTQQTGQRPRIGLGGGIVADSEPDAEWLELQDKRRFLSQAPDPVGLIETMRVEGQGVIPRLESHLARLALSARMLGIGCDLAQVRAELQAYIAGGEGGLEVPWALRLELSSQGKRSFSRRGCPWPPAAGLRVRLARDVVDRHDRLLRLKTTRRALFNAAYQEALAAGYDDALFVNTIGHLTEGAIRGLVARKGGQWRVSPLEDGVMDSLWRTEMVAQLGAVEQSLPLTQLGAVAEIWMGNSVQGGCRVRQIDDQAGTPIWIMAAEPGFP